MSVKILVQKLYSIKWQKYSFVLKILKFLSLNATLMATIKIGLKLNASVVCIISLPLSVSLMMTWFCSKEKLNLWIVNCKCASKSLGKMQILFCKLYITNQIRNSYALIFCSLKSLDPPSISEFGKHRKTVKKS